MFLCLSSIDFAGCAKVYQFHSVPTIADHNVFACKKYLVILEGLNEVKGMQKFCIQFTLQSITFDVKMKNFSFSM